MTRPLFAHYQALARSREPQTRKLGQRQLASLRRTSTPPSSSAVRTSRWRHVPLAELFEAVGNPLHRRASGRFECGHEPLHASKSGRCVSIDPVRGLWFCRSCQRGGDAASLVMLLRGCAYSTAAAELQQAYGRPLDATRSRRSGSVPVEVVP